MTEQKELKVVELFAGVGGFRVGLENTDKEFFHTIWANQWEPGKKDQFAFECYKRHYGDTDSILVNDDIEKVKDSIPDHDLLVGGFPCQDYSVATTKAKGIEGKKGVLWWSIYDILQNKHPDYVMLENVDRLLKSPATQRGRDFAIILKCLTGEGYDVEWRVIDASKYGARQRRIRTYIFAYHTGSKIYDAVHRYTGWTESNWKYQLLMNTGFMARSFTTREMDNIVDFDIGNQTIQQISDSFEFRFKDSGYVDRFGRGITGRYTPPDWDFDCLGSVMQTNVPKKYYLNDDQLSRITYLKGKKKVERTKKNGFMYWYKEGAVAFPDSEFMTARTMLTSEGTVNRSSHVVKDSETEELRFLTPEECEQLNEFPKGWTEGMTDRKRYFCMGNALVTTVIGDMAKTIKELEMEE